MSVRWLDRRIAAPGPYLTLCLTEVDFKAALRHCKVQEHVPFVAGDHADATAHLLLNPKGQRVCIVTLKGWEGRDPVEVAGLLVHEAVHVWQEYCLSIGEHHPAREQEAYAVQTISQELMASFARQIGAR